eukprot:GHVR01172041.1.p1 GENE.GHVR01172041.1~~GHVR01172041.1.p1  ORF type:complete len:183 (-),score=26.55 GHVR01172041.1:39-587(-)
MIAGKKYAPSSDIWSCGVILFALVSGYLPFEDPDTSKLYKKIMSELLRNDPTKRPTPIQIRQHRWFRMKEILPIGSDRSIQSIFPRCDVYSCQSCLNWKCDGKNLPDEHVLHQMKKLSFDPIEVERDLSNSQHNQTTATYFLLLERRHRQLESIQKNTEKQRPVRYSRNGLKLQTHTHTKCQ